DIRFGDAGGGGWGAADGGIGVFRLGHGRGPGRPDPRGDEHQRLEAQAAPGGVGLLLRASTPARPPSRRCETSTFSPPGTTREIEEYAAGLDGVTPLELRIVPDISGGNARASLERMQLASTWGCCSRVANEPDNDMKFRFFMGLLAVTATVAVDRDAS